MAKLELRPQEKLLAKEAASNVMNMLFIPQPNPGKLTVTNQRIKFDESARVDLSRGNSAFRYSVEKAEGLNDLALHRATCRRRQPPLGERTTAADSTTTHLRVVSKCALGLD